MTPHLKDIVSIVERSLEIHEKQKQTFIEKFAKDPVSCLSWLGDSIHYTVVAIENCNMLLNILWRHEITKDAEKPAAEVTVIELQSLAIRSLLERGSDPMNSTSGGSRAIHKAEIQFWSRASILMRQNPAILDKNFKL